MGRWPSGAVVQAIESIRKQPQLVLGHVNSQAVSKCKALPELVKATVPLAGSEAQELKLTLSEMREACRALKAAADQEPSHATAAISHLMHGQHSQAVSAAPSIR